MANDSQQPPEDRGPRGIHQIADSDLLDLVRRLLAYEAHDDHRASDAALFHVSEKLRRALSRLAGTAGFCSLLSRALTMARAKVPSLSVLRINPDGSLEGLEAFEACRDTTEAGALLITQLLALLILFVGESPVLTLLSDIWPDLFPGIASDGEQVKT
jgi:hypothetical protein